MIMIIKIMENINYKKNTFISNTIYENIINMYYQLYSYLNKLLKNCI